MLSSGRRGPRGSRGRRGGRGGLAITDEVPCTVKDTFGFRGEEIEKTTRQVETAIWASRTLVHDCGSCGLPIVCHENLLEAVGTGVSAAELLNNEGQTATATVDRAEPLTGVFRATMKSLATLF